MAIRVKEVSSELVEAYKEGKSPTAIARDYKVGRTTVYRALWDVFGAPLPARKKGKASIAA